MADTYVHYHKDSTPDNESLLYSAAIAQLKVSHDLALQKHHRVFGSFGFDPRSPSGGELEKIFFEGFSDLNVSALPDVSIGGLSGDIDRLLAGSKAGAKAVAQQVRNLEDFVKKTIEACGGEGLPHYDKITQMITGRKANGAAITYSQDQFGKVIGGSNPLLTRILHQLHIVQKYIDYLKMCEGEMKTSGSIEQFVDVELGENGKNAKKIGNVLRGHINNILGAVAEYAIPSVVAEKVYSELAKVSSKGPYVTLTPDKSKTKIKYLGTENMKAGSKSDALVSIFMANGLSIDFSLNIKRWPSKDTFSWNRSYGRSTAPLESSIAKFGEQTVMNSLAFNPPYPTPNGKVAAVLRYAAAKDFFEYIGYDAMFMAYPDAIIPVYKVLEPTTSGTPWAVGLEYSKGGLGNKWVGPSGEEGQASSSPSRVYAKQRSNNFLAVARSASGRLLHFK